MLVPTKPKSAQSWCVIQAFALRLSSHPLPPPHTHTHMHPARRARVGTYTHGIFLVPLNRWRFHPPGSSVVA